MRPSVPSISRLAINSPTLTLALWVALSILGLFSFLSLNLALFPDIAFPVVVVPAGPSQIHPATNESAVANRMETALKKIRGLTHIHSLTYPEFVVVDMNF